MIRCLIVDDSPTFRQVLRRILATAPNVEVVGEATDGTEAVRKTLELQPDVITMDVHQIDAMMRTVNARMPAAFHTMARQRPAREAASRMEPIFWPW